MTTLALALALLQEDALGAVRNALEKTESQSYYYAVEGRFKRTGEWVPPGLLTARIDTFQSARHGQTILVKGPEGLWKTPGERLGELVEKPDKEAADRVKTLEEAEPPHKILRELLDLADKAVKGDDREMDGVKCAVYTVSYSKERLRTYLEKQMEKSIQRGTLAKPDEVKWSTLKGSLRLYVSKGDGAVARVVDERSVKIEYKQSGAPDSRTYTNEMTFEISGWGKAAAELPAEIKDKLGIQEK
jgi:hypothetical protein